MKIKVVTDEDFLKFCKGIKKYLPAEPTSEEIDAMNWPISVTIEVDVVPKSKVLNEKTFAKAVQKSLRKMVKKKEIVN